MLDGHTDYADCKEMEGPMKFVRLTLVFFVLAVAAGSAQSIEFATKAYDAPAFSATFPGDEELTNSSLATSITGGP